MKLTLRERMNQLKTARPKIEGKIRNACRDATIRAVEKAAGLTPPTQDDLGGTNTRTGKMQQDWAVKSKWEPVKQGNSFVTQLNNDMPYASYVNDGHRMNRHFVPGLYIDPLSGLLEYDPSKDVGIVVGTRTSYVPGIFMVDAAKEEYKRVLREELKDIGEVLE